MMETWSYVHSLGEKKIFFFFFFLQFQMVKISAWACH